MPVLLSAGCSFTFGAELSDQIQGRFSDLSWAALLAKKMNMEHTSVAKSGASNQTISRLLINKVHSWKPDFVAVMWTFINRYEYFYEGQPKLVNVQLAKQDSSVDNYYKICGADEHQQVYNSMMNFLLIQEYLTNRKIPYICTIADKNPLNRWITVNGKLQPGKLIVDHNPSIRSLVNEIDWEKWFWIDSKHTNDGFYDWGHRNFEVGPNNHPLEQAHSTLAEQMLPMALTLYNR